MQEKSGLKRQQDAGLKRSYKNQCKIFIENQLVLRLSSQNTFDISLFFDLIRLPLQSKFKSRDSGVT